MPTILLATLNARYIHSALGLRYLHANMAELAGRTAIREFTIAQRPLDIAEALLGEQPQILGLAVYVWNARECEELVGLLKQLAPELTIILGGPELSYEWQEQAIVAQADYLITGQADLAFAALCRQLLAGKPPAERIIHAAVPHPDQLVLPYELYSDEDIAQRVVYVEASRGCPFRCEFCLSALDKTAVPFALREFLAAMERLHQRGLRHFKFIDRSFNLKIEHSRAILEFFLERLDEKLFLHFELIPDRLPEALRELIARFPPGSLQFEIGIQSLNPEVQQRIDRKQDMGRSVENLRWLREHSHAHLHVDLIIGLPGEDMASFGQGFDQLQALNPHEIQLGLLKRLRGAPIVRHSEAFEMRYMPMAPYTVLTTSAIPFDEMQRLARFARYWDLVANSGRFSQSLPLLLGSQPFAHFMRFSDWLYQSTGQTHKIQLEKLFNLIHQALTELFQLAPETVEGALLADYQRSGHKGRLLFQRQTTQASDPSSQQTRRQRQQRHQH
jgi:radical SAM superfamily enzyme YgiQ (UPF0313 family)